MWLLQTGLADPQTVNEAAFFLSLLISAFFFRTIKKYDRELHNQELLDAFLKE